MAGANAGIQRGSVIHGARMYVVLDGKKVAYVQRVSITQQKTVQAVEALDDILDVEHVTTGIKYSGSLTGIAIMARSLVQAGIHVPIEQVFSSPQKNIQLVDSVTNRVWKSLEDVTFSGFSADVAKGQFTQESLNFMCIAVIDQDRVHGV